VLKKYVQNIQFSIGNIDGFVKSRESLKNVIPAPHFMRDKLQPESSTFNYFWMPVADPVISGDQVRHDGIGTFTRLSKAESAPS